MCEDPGERQEQEEPDVEPEAIRDKAPGRSQRREEPLDAESQVEPSRKGAKVTPQAWRASVELTAHVIVAEKDQQRPKADLEGGGTCQSDVGMR